MIIRQEDRKRHIHISGKTQYGKSTLMLGMMYQDARNGAGLCLIDAKGDLAPKILDWIPERRKADVIYLDLETPIPLDFMACASYKERMNLVSDIIQVFNRMEDGLGTRMDAIIRWTVVTLDMMGPSCFLDIFKVITDESFRARIRVHPAIRENPVVYDFWNNPNQAEKLIKGESGLAIAFSRMTRFVLSPTFQVILGTTNAALNIAEAVQQKKIILVQLEPNSDEGMLYGSLIVSKIQQAIYRRKPGNNPPFALYIDEFQHFKTSGFEQAIPTVGGLGLYLTLANQFFDQLKETELKSAIINSVSTFFLFNMDPKNAGEIAGQIREEPVREAASTTEALRKQLSTLKSKLKWWRDRERHWDNEHGDTDDEKRDIAATQRENSMTIFNLEQEIDRVAAQIETSKFKPPKPEPLVSRLPSLKAGTCLYRPATGYACLIKVPNPPSLSSVGKTSHAEWIRQNTVATYSQKRTGDNSALQSAAVRQNEGDGNHPHRADPEETATPNIPPYKNDRKGS